MPSPVRLVALFGAGMLSAGCGGGMPLFHPAHALPPDHVTMGAGVTSQFVTGKASDRIQAARATMVDGAVVSNETNAYVAGALAEALLSPGLAPWVGARAGMGYTSDVGLAYTGHAVRLDGRHAFEFGNVAVSAGLGASAVLLNPGHEGPTDVRGTKDTAIPGLDTGGVNGFGFDAPIIVGWKSDADLFQVYGGARGGYERLGGQVRLRVDTDPSIEEEDPIQASRWYALGLFGVMVGIDPVAVALELDAGYQTGSGTITRTPAALPRQRVDGKVDGVTFTPGAAAFGRF